MNPPPLGGWPVQQGTILLVLLFASVGTWPVCLVIFGRYRRAVARGMQRADSAMPFTFLPTEAHPATGPVREIALVPAQAPLSAPLVNLSLLAVGHLPLAQVLLLLALVVALPLVFVLAGSARAVRGAAWLVGPALVAIGYAVWELSSVVLVLFGGVWVGTLAVPFIAKAVGALLLVALYAWGMMRLYTAKVLSESLDPDELLDFLTFRLPRRFVQRVDTIGPRLADLDLRPDRDGRYRVNELMCHDDTWRPTVAAATAETHRGNQ